MTWRSYLVFLLLLIPVQTTLVEQFSFAGIKPDLGLVLVYFIGIRMGAAHGLVMGVVVGILVDLFSGGVLGANMITKPIVGWVSGSLSRTVIDIHILVSVALLFSLSMLTGLLTYAYLELFLGGASLLTSIRAIILPQALYDSAVGMMALSLFPFRGKSRGKELEA